MYQIGNELQSKTLTPRRGRWRFHSVLRTWGTRFSRGPNALLIVAPSSLPSEMAADSSALYARNLLNFVNLLFDAKTGEFRIDRSDEIIAGTLVCADGAPARS